MALGNGFRGVTSALVLVVSVLFLGGCNEKLTDENYDRLTVGMFYSEVEGIIGEGTREDSGGYGISGAGIPTGSNSGDSKQQTFTWDEGDKKLIIVFNNGKLQSKSKMGW